MILNVTIIIRVTLESGNSVFVYFEPMIKEKSQTFKNKYTPSGRETVIPRMVRVQIIYKM